MTEQANADRVSGVAFGIVQRVLAVLIAAGLLAWTIYLWRSFNLREGATWLWFAALGIVQWTAFWIWNSRVTADREKIVQTWMWKKEIRREEIATLNFVHVRGLAWLITPRVVVRTNMMMLTTIPLAAPNVRAFVENKYPDPTGHL